MAVSKKCLRALSGAGLSLVALHSLWLRSDRGDKVAGTQLRLALADYPDLQPLIAQFEAGGGIKEASGKAMGKFMAGNTRPNIQWAKLSTSSKTAMPLIAGLPSLGKRK